MKVLIVEDDPWMAGGNARLLEDDGHHVHTVSNAVAAIDAVDQFAPEVIVLDVLLPVGTGFALLHELQSYADTATLPVIVTTSLAADMTVEQLSPYGVRRLLDKATMRPTDLLAAVRSVA